MSETSRGVDKEGPDYFGFYTHEVAELFSQDEDFIPFSSQDFASRTHGILRDKEIAKETYNGKGGNIYTGSGSLFHDVIGAGFSDFKKERLRALLRQSVVFLTQAVDEMLDPVVAMCRIRYLRHEKNLSSEACEDDTGEHPRKKLKLSSSSSLISVPLHASPVRCRVSGEDLGNEHMDVVVPGTAMPNGGEKDCAHFHLTKTSKWRTGPESPVKENESLSVKDSKESFLGSMIEAEKEIEEVNDDLQLLLKNDGQIVEETMRKYSEELSTTLGRMEEKLEELLDTVMSSCRSMSHAEKHQLRNLIQKLPMKNLDRVMEIIQHRKPPENHSCNEIHVDLAEEDNITLWRLYYYVETVESARKL